MKGLHERLGHASDDVLRVRLDQGASPEIEGCRQRRTAIRISRNLLEGKMIVREQTLYGVDPIGRASMFLALVIHEGTR